MKITYLGHSTIVIEEGDFKGIIDPYISSSSARAAKAEDLKGITHIFVTHGHADHLGDTVELAQRNNALVISNIEIKISLEQFNINTYPLYIGGKMNFDFGKVKMVYALHGSSITGQDGRTYGGNPCGYIIEINGKKIYHAGDTGLTMEMKLLEVENIDVALLPIGGYYTMDIDDAKIATEFIKAKKVVPIHYNTFELIKADPKEFKEKVKVKGCEVVILDIDDSLEV